MLSLLGSRRFAPLFWCQFFAAFNDNLLKTALVFLILFHAGGSNALITLAGAVLIAPFFFLSGLGGELADRFDKARVAQRLKFVEIFVAAVSALGFWMQSVPVLFVALAGFGILAALFGPVKYGILPDHLRPEELPGGNALIEGATFVAILLGTIAGGVIGGNESGSPVFSAGVLGIALAAWVAALFIPGTRAAVPNLEISANIVRSSTGVVARLARDGRIIWGALVTSWFWLIGILVLSLLPPLIKNVIGGDEGTVTACLAIFSVGVGVGSALAARLARGRIRLGITICGGVLVGLFALDLAWTISDAVQPSSLRTPADVFASALGIHAAVDLTGLAMSGGLFVVPAFAAVQAWAGVEYRARTIAGVNVLNAGFMTAGSILLALLQHAGVSMPVLFAAIGLSTLLATLAISKTMPKDGAALSPPHPEEWP
jgi:acyl-[acyl-carrier-protein]-phospholipid O-acyltransferase / long-chain-fatty-acid--[acyl-carrier-protein] ligase